MSKKKKSNQLKYFVFYFSRLKHRIPILLALKGFVAFLDGIGLSLFIPLLQITESGESSRETLGKLAFVIDFFEKIGIELSIGNLLIFMLFLFSTKAIINYGSSLYFAKIRVNFMKKTRIELIDGICNVSYPNFVNTDLGRIQNVLTTEVGRAIGAFTSIFSTLQYVVMLLGYLTLAFLTNFQFALLITVAGVLTNYIFQVIGKKIESDSLMRSLINNGLQGRVLETVFNYKYLKATDLISNYRKKLIKLTSEAEAISLKMGKLNVLAGAIREPIIMLFVCTIVFIQVVLMGVSMLSVALSLVFFMRSLNCLLSVQSNWLSFLGSSGGVRLVNALNEELGKNIETKEHENVENLKDNIQFENVTFSYSPDLPAVLININLTINKNQTVAFVGESGSGKTTLVNMLAGLFMPVTGQIKVDGVPLTTSRVKKFRQQVGYITQEPVVFNDTVFNNITFHEPKNEDIIEKFRETLEKTTLTSMVENLPEKEASMLGDNGILISGGQKQRVSIARELFRECSILLMDEATSALDTENELIIQENINKLKGKYTIVIIAHRLSTVKSADVIYLIDKGKIEAFGNFEELKDKSPRFRKMVELQEF